MIRTTLRLERTLVVFDLETTGVDTATDRIVEVCCVHLQPDGQRRVTTQRVNPGMPIPADATAVHGITDDDVATAPAFAEIAAELHAALAECDLSGFNVEKFDIPLLAAEFRRVGLPFPHEGTRVLDSSVIFRRMEPRNLTHALRVYCDRELEDAHSAEADAVAAADVLLAQVARYAELPKEVGELHGLLHEVPPGALDSGGKFVWREGEVVFNFGKHKHRPLRELAEENPDYLRWLLGKDFPADTKALASDALDGRFPEAPADQRSGEAAPTKGSSLFG